MGKGGITKLPNKTAYGAGTTGAITAASGGRTSSISSFAGLAPGSYDAGAGSTYGGGQQSNPAFAMAQ